MKSRDDFPVISIITVCRNAKDFVEQTIGSVLSQNYPHIEYIIIDGASTDGTVEIIRRHEANLAYWQSKPDQGIAPAFNLGLERANGDWILYLNADDFFVDATVVGQMVPYLRQHRNADVVYGQVEIISAGKEAHPFPFNRVLGRQWSWGIFRLYNIIPHQAAFTNRHYFARMGNFDEHCTRSVDYEYFLRGGKDLKAVFVPLKISKMRQGGISNRHIISSLQEYKNAQLKHQALSLWEAWLNFSYRILSFYGRLYWQKIIGHLSLHLSLSNRSSDRS
jgi:glycosyltransferase involved in cell wall biosynthesis